MRACILVSVSADGAIRFWDALEVYTPNLPPILLCCCVLTMTDLGVFQSTSRLDDRALQAKLMLTIADACELGETLKHVSAEETNTFLFTGDSAGCIKVRMYSRSYMHFQMHISWCRVAKEMQSQFSSAMHDSSGRYGTSRRLLTSLYKEDLCL